MWCASDARTAVRRLLYAEAAEDIPMKVMRPKTEWFYQPRVWRSREWQQRVHFIFFKVSGATFAEYKQPRRLLWWRTKLIAALAVLLLAFTLLACTDVGDGSCKAPSPCGQRQGQNP
jgi:hypothetical protein